MSHGFLGRHGSRTALSLHLVGGFGGGGLEGSGLGFRVGLVGVDPMWNAMRLKWLRQAFLTKWMAPTPTQPKTTFFQLEMTTHLSNKMLICLDVWKIWGHLREIGSASTRRWWVHLQTIKTDFEFKNATKCQKEPDPTTAISCHIPKILQVPQVTF